MACTHHRLHIICLFVCLERAHTLTPDTLIIICLFVCLESLRAHTLAPDAFFVFDIDDSHVLFRLLHKHKPAIPFRKRWLYKVHLSLFILLPSHLNDIRCFPRPSHGPWSGRISALEKNCALEFSTIFSSSLLIRLPSPPPFKQPLPLLQPKQRG